MKVLSVHNRYRSGSPSGEDRVVDREAAALAEQGHTVERFERFSDDIDRRSLLGKALVPGQVLWSESARRSLMKTLEKSCPEVVHIHNTFPLLSPSVLYACRERRVPVVSTIHNYRLLCPRGDLFRDGGTCHDCVGELPLPALKYRCYRDSLLATAPLATGLVLHRQAWRTMVSAYVFLSHAQRDLFVGNGVPAERSFVKPNLVPYSSTAPSQERENIVVYAGRLSVEKGVDLLMEAWDRYLVREEGDSLRLVLAGSGPLEQRVRQWTDVQSSADWQGLLSPTDLGSLLRRARAVVIPSRCLETFGLVAVEAMAAGVLPIAPAHGPFVETITSGTDGLLFTPGSSEELADIFGRLARHPSKWESLGRAAQRTYEQRYAPDRNLRQLLNIYEFAISQPAF